MHMKSFALFTGSAIAVLNLLLLFPALQPYGVYLVAASIALSLWLAVKALTFRHLPTATSSAATADLTATPGPGAEAEVITLMGIFQEKGRLIDFLMDDITGYSDAQVGAAGRVVHEGCKAALQEHFRIVPISAEREGAQVTVPAEAAGIDYRMVGKVQGQPPFSGTLVHKGWKAESVHLPRMLENTADRLPPIAPAQVELK